MINILDGIYKCSENDYIIGYEGILGKPVHVDKETMISEFCWIGFSKRKAEKLVKQLDKAYEKALSKGANL